MIVRYYYYNYSITVSSINDLNSYNVERIISIKGDLDQQIRAVETIYAKLCLAYENDNARVWNYSPSQYQQQQQQQQQLMQQFAQQAATMAAAASGGLPLLPTHYAQQQQQSVIQQAHPTAIYHQPYYVNEI